MVDDLNQHGVRVMVLYGSEKGDSQVWGDNWDSLGGISRNLSWWVIAGG